MSINMTVQRDNWHEMGDLTKLALQKDVAAMILMLYGPPELSLLTYDEAKRMEILDYCFEKLDWEILKYCRRAIVSLLDSLPPSEMRESRIQKFANIGTGGQPITTSV